MDQRVCRSIARLSRSVAAEIMSQRVEIVAAQYAQRDKGPQG